MARGAVLEVPELVEIGEAHDATAAQVALAWALARDIAPIPKATGEGHIRENAAARELSLTEAELARIDAIERRERQIDPDVAPWN